MSTQIPTCTCGNLPIGQHLPGCSAIGARTYNRAPSPVFTCSHPMELSALVYALQAVQPRDMVTGELLRRARAASQAADEADRANQLAGGRAAND